MSEEPASEGGESDPATGMADLAKRVDALAEAVDDLNADLDEKIEDVRARVIQVKREADAKAPADHDHPEFASEVSGAGESLENDLADMRTEQERLAEGVERLDNRLEAGFGNYEEILEYLMDVTDATEDRMGRVVDAVGDLRTRVGRLEARRTERAAADRLSARAQSQGVAAAKCEDCGGSVQLGLLTAARCPHCEASLADVESRGFLRSAVLRTGSRPALEDPGADDSPPLTDVETEPERSRPPVEGLSASDEGDSADPRPSSDATSGGSHDGPGDESPPVEAVPGIGSAYAERLREAGVGTVDDLASAEPGQLADRTEIAPGRVETWIEQARELDRPG